MTKEQYDRLKNYESTLRSALNSNFARVSQGEFNKIADIYKELYGTALTKSQMVCNACKLSALKRLAMDYNEYEAWYNKKYKKSQKDSNLASQNNPSEGK